MSQEIRRIFGVRYQYDNPIDQRRADGLVNLLVFGTSIWLVWLIFLGLPEILEGEGLSTLNTGILSSPLLALIIYFSLQRGWLAIASTIFIGSMLPAGLFSIAETSLNSGNLIFVAMPMVAAGLLLRPRGYYLVMLILTIAVISIAITEYVTFDEAREDGLLGPLISLALIGLFFVFWVGYTDELLENARTDLNRYRYLGGFNARISRMSEDRALHDFLVYVRTTLRYSFVQYFAVDESNQLTRRLRAGVGAKGILDETEVSISDVNALAIALNSQSTLTVDSSDSSIRRDHLLPSSAFGLIVPIIVNDKAVGVIDLQDNARPFSESDVNLLVSLADQLGAILTDITRFNSMRDELQESHATIASLRSRVRTGDAVVSQAVGSDWEAYLEQRGRGAVGFDMQPGNNQLLLMGDLPETMQAALQAGDVVTESADGVHRVIVPIRLRDDVIGAMAFNVDGTRPLSRRRVEMVQDVADRLALALENKRLFEQSLAQATRERKANEIGNRLLTATDIDTLLNVAADSFNEALGAVQTYIHVQPEDTAPSPVNGNHQATEDGETS